MSKYFFDTEFLEGTQSKSLFGLKYGETKPTIDLISIGIVSDGDSEYYAVSKDFNLREAWDRYDLRRAMCIEGMTHKKLEKVYWIRDNVLKPIFDDLVSIESKFIIDAFNLAGNKLTVKDLNYKFNYKTLKELINNHGKSNKQIAEEVEEFCKLIEGHIYSVGIDKTIAPCKNLTETIGDRPYPEFYGYGQDKCFVFMNFMKNYGSL